MITKRSWRLLLARQFRKIHTSPVLGLVVGLAVAALFAGVAAAVTWAIAETPSERPALFIWIFGGFTWTSIGYCLILHPLLVEPWLANKQH